LKAAVFIAAVFLQRLVRWHMNKSLDF